tara:strand:+ start:31884 stop:32222 length:339 start_codon:yes stop_codon:yes gene_type:complete
MKPITYSRVSAEEVIYHHNFSELKKFLAYGFEHGNNGWILVREEKNFLVFKGFGTIEAPCLSLRTIYLEHDPIMDGVRSTPEEIINPSKEVESLTTSFKVVIWNTAEATTDL